MTFDKENINLGKMKKGDKKTFQYNFENAGTETIEIQSVSSCECTTIDYLKNIDINTGGAIFKMLNYQFELFNQK
jgi:phage tail tube protein FII